jgi:hypothetical protein
VALAADACLPAHPAQLESRKLRRLWFLEASGTEPGQAQVISYDYALLPTLLS